MKYVKSKNLLVVSVLSISLVQITDTVYSPAAKPFAKPSTPIAKPAIARPKAQIPKTLAKPIAKLTAKSALKDTTNIRAIDPFLTFDMVSDTTNVTFFSKFNAALALSNFDTPSNPRQAAVDNPAYFFPTLSDCVNTIYDGNNAYTPKFNDKRYIYGQFSNSGKTLQLYTDQTHTNILGTFTLPTPKQDGEYIYKLLWNTDAHIPLSQLKNDPTNKVDPNGNIRGWIIFSQETALNNGSVIIELVNPNDKAYQELSQITDFTNFTFEDMNNKLISVDKTAIDKLNTIYNGKNNPATINPAITPNDYRARIGNLVKQALINPQQTNLDYAKTDFLSQYYGPKILISFGSQQIKIEAYYNVMWAGLVAADSGLCVISYVKRNEYDTSSFNAVNIKKIKSTLLSAPIVKDQLLFYLDAGFDNSNTQVAYISKSDPSDPGNPYVNVKCDCYKSKSCNF